jgi:hypothetical protein
MEIQPPKAIELKSEEQELLGEIDFEPSCVGSRTSREDWIRICEAAHDLTISLLTRGAIPQIRWEYFTKPKYNAGPGKKSRQQVFESNGTCGEEILRHPHFLKYLEYFIFGPALPEATKAGFCELLERGYRHTELHPFVRQETRRLGLDRNTAGEEFYKLALECEQEFWARHLRDEARQAARR